ncbi:hypothetical protein Ocin01_18922 [Orchesella cincta]|uniref:Uncharacterized protein n=1 Tax=Orchesella cincta TaxID=48709 RepID=A0A1D2M457_ORCCI|nr:hypothetical protein Ocin01_18922 [Orchesella cincta]
MCFKKWKMITVLSISQGLLCNGLNLSYLPPSLRECCANCKKLGVSCFKPITYISWIYKRESKRHDRRPPSLGPVTPPTMIELPGIAQELFFMLIMALIYLTVLMLLEYRIVQRFFEMIAKVKPLFSEYCERYDVMAEANRVDEMFKNGNPV